MSSNDAQRHLGIACKTGDVPRALEAIAAGADVNADVFSPDGYLDGFDTDKFACTATCVAAANAHAAVLSVLIDNGADVDKGDPAAGITPCHSACTSNCPDAVTLLLEHGADPNLADKEGWTSLHIAAFRGYTRCMRALAEGARAQGKPLVVNALSNAKMSALDIALEKGHAEAAAYLRDELGAKRGVELVDLRMPWRNGTPS